MIQLKSYSIMKIRKSQIALQYFPELSGTPSSALHRLRNWMKRNKPLMQKLHKMGYNTNGYYFNKRQVMLIYEYLGEPDE